MKRLARMSGSGRTVVLLSVALAAVAQVTHRLDARSDEPVVTSAQAVAEQQAIAPPAPPPERPDFAMFLEGIRTEARARGISEKTIEATLTGIDPLPIVVERDRSQAETVLSVEDYIRRRLTPAFIRTARQMAARHRTLLRKVGEQFNVQPRFVIAIWGLESNFGRFTGVRPTIPALVTLAWDGRRGPFFRAELFDALQIIERGYIGASQLKGSWAGAMGQPQFMPSSYLKWAQDFDGDGDRDIWRSEADIFASVANYLKEHGWSDEHTWGREVRTASGEFDRIVEQVGLRQEGCRAERQMTVRAPLSKWNELGVRRADGGPLPAVDLDASLVPTGGRTFLVYSNYESILEYNCAHAYALSVALLADRVGQ